MVCRTVLIITNNKIKQNGGNAIVLSKFVNNVNLKELSKIRENLKLMQEIDHSLIVEWNNVMGHEIFDENGFFSRDYTKKLLLNYQGDALVDEILRIANPMDRYDRTLAWMLYESENVLFTTGQIKKLGNPSYLGHSLAYVMAKDGSKFNVDDLIYFKTTSNDEEPDGNSIAHAMILHGHNFSIDEILKLGNLSNNNGKTLAHSMIRRNLYEFSINELLLLNNVADVYGNTLAHYMAFNGHLFSKEEIILLKNPKNIKGETIQEFYLKKRKSREWESLNELR